jgi:hypothetical protein
MIFNGHSAESIDKIDEETFTEICVMFSDGILGNKGTFDAITPLTTAVFNYIRPSGAPAYKSENIFPWVVEYEKNPDLELPKQDMISNALLSFMMQAPGFSMEKINGDRTVPS